jgi:hypothetical protein
MGYFFIFVGVRDIFPSAVCEDEISRISNGDGLSEHEARLSHKNFTCLSIDTRVETESAKFSMAPENFSVMFF